jgi:hypothetical protein
MKPLLMRALACELVLIVLPMLAAQAQNAQPDLTALKIQDHVRWGRRQDFVWGPGYRSRLSLGLVGQDLLRNLHQEYAGPDLTELPSLIRRSAYARITWRF